MDFGIGGKVAMVAAASKGIGLAAAKQLALEGCSLSICARNEDELERAATEIGEETRTYVVDVADPDDLAWWVEQTTADLGQPSILVTNTGGPPAGAVLEMTDEQWLDGFNSTFLNVIRMVRLVSHSMRAQKWGRIVHVTSYVAREPSDLLPISSTLRAGLMGLTRVQSNALAPHGITVNSVLPGNTLTGRQHHLAEVRAEKEGISVEQALEAQGKMIPVGRMATADEIGSSIAFLCSQQAAFVSGVNLLVDGGMVKGLG